MGGRDQVGRRINWNRTFVTAGCLVGAGVVYVGLLRPGGMNIFDEPGSAADWVAAVGTWMIGYGANKFAGNSYQLKLHEKREVALKEASARIDALKSRVAGIEGWMSQIRMAQRLLQSFPFDVAKPNQVTDVIDQIRKFLQSGPWDMDDIARMDQVAIGEITKAERRLGEVQAWIQVTVDRLDEDGRASVSSTRVDELRSIAGLLDDVVEAGARFVALISRDAAEQEAQRDRIAERLQRDFEDLLGG